ncbi:hypothetical protein JO84_gp252 [Aureococcus anophagefferens virus]|uniref:SLATT domain-containing protein n=1 Tax=Aureococcus anophagefferens virus TaxID=1474867 RepID=A0A076FFI3_9VIRU|nr:hypothetical protein JO84_gp252 [Aureococcus anophagefferens virus]AII17009.1 hypothetical protein AaV_223 [Aureococcus anophagefferens virus]UOG94137.1 hypothetical protein MKD35_96 [Aureococcus anophagefferens virus]
MDFSHFDASLTPQLTKTKKIKLKSKTKNYYKSKRHVESSDDNASLTTSDDRSADMSREEEPWTQNIEKLISTWNHHIAEKIELHNNAGYFYKRQKQIYGLPPILLSVCMAPVSGTFYDYSWIKYVNMVSFVTVAFFSGIDNFFNFGSRKEKHFNHSARYSELKTYIESQLFKKKQFRVEADVFLTEVRMKYDNLTITEPTIPKKFLIQNEKTKNIKQSLKQLAYEDKNEEENC